MQEPAVNLMVGTRPDGNGGVASVVSVLVGEGFLRRHRVRYVSSHCDGNMAIKAAFGFRSLVVVFWTCAIHRPGIVHVHSASHASFIRKSLLLAVARAFGWSTIFHSHGAGFQRFINEDSGSVMRWWIRKTLEKSTSVIALSESWKTFFSSYAPGAAVKVVPNSVTLHPLPERWREESGRILFLGRAEKRKGINELLAAVSLLKDSIPNIKLVVGGDGDLDALKIKSRELGIAEHLEVLGWIGPTQKTEQLARAAVFCLPSFDEGLPMAMLEAMAAGKGIVVTPVGGIPDAVQHCENGLLVPPGNAEALACALKKMLEGEDLRCSLGTKARKTIEERFNTDAMITELSVLYHALSGGPYQ